MKRFIIPVIFLLLAGLSACSDKIDIAAPYKDVVVVNAIFNMGDTAHYVRIQKAFMDENKSAVIMAKEDDSSFFKNLNVQLIEHTPGSSGVITMPLFRVNMEDEGYPKEAVSGAFFNTPNYAYKVQLPSGHQLGAYKEYTLTIENLETGKIDSSDVFMMVNNDSAQKNGSFFVSKFLVGNLPVNFARTISSSFAFAITGNYPENARMVEGHLIFHYIDSNVTTQTSTRKTIDFLFATDALAAGVQQFELKVENSAIYNYLFDEMGPAPSNVLRYMDSCDIRVLAGSKELFTYQQVFLGQKGGLTGDQIQPNYTNMKGENVLGVIGSRAERYYTNAPIDEITLDSVMKSSFMQPLSIKGRTAY